MVALTEPAAIDPVYITEELYRRAPSSTDFRREKIALQDLARQMVDRPAEVLPRLVDLALELCEGISGGISLYESTPAPGVFRWHYLRGELTKFTGETTPRNFSPCGVTLDLNKVILVTRPERLYSWLAEANISVAECLLVPLYVGSEEPIGTLWIVSAKEKHFDPGHARVVTELAAFAGIAVGMIRTEQRLKDSLSQQETLTREMSHRVKNLFTIAGGLIRVSARTASTPAEMAELLTGRMNALAAANALVRRTDDKSISEVADLEELVRKVLLPHEQFGKGIRTIVNGPPIYLGQRSTRGIALILHEFATNAAKYGALQGSESGLVTVTWHENNGELLILWRERGGPIIAAPPVKMGFGTALSQSTVVGQFEGSISYDWDPLGLSIAISLRTANLHQ